MPDGLSHRSVAETSGTLSRPRLLSSAKIRQVSAVPCSGERLATRRATSFVAVSSFLANSPRCTEHRGVPPRTAAHRSPANFRHLPRNRRARSRRKCLGSGNRESSLLAVCGQKPENAPLSFSSCEPWSKRTPGSMRFNLSRNHLASCACSSRSASSPVFVLARRKQAVPLARSLAPRNPLRCGVLARN
jgi:hypothetical protein